MLFSASSSLYFTKTASSSLQENPGNEREENVVKQHNQLERCYILIRNYMFRPIMAIVRFLYQLRGVYISEWGGVDVEISMHQFPVALLSSANSYGQLNN